VSACRFVSNTETGLRRWRRWATIFKHRVITNANMKRACHEYCPKVTQERASTFCGWTALQYVFILVHLKLLKFYIFSAYEIVPLGARNSSMSVSGRDAQSMGWVLLNFSPTGSLCSHVSVLNFLNPEIVHSQNWRCAWNEYVKSKEGK
jgi:hypothetical protein